MKYRQTFTYCFFSAWISMVLAVTFSIPARAQSALNLPQLGVMIPLSTPYNPPIIKGITIYPDNPLKFDFIVDPGDDNFQGDALKAEANKLIKYFMAALTVPEDEMWVNLSPYEKDRIIADELSQTELGRDMLVEDYILKQVTASLMYPEEKLGSDFWKRVYANAKVKYGTTEIPVNTFNKVWIVPDKANVYVNGNNVFVVDNHLKVMLEEDYLALEINLGRDNHGVGKVSEDQTKKINEVSKQIIREILIPEIEKEVNHGKNFSNLRQIFNSMILATWYKQNLRKSLLGQVYVNQNKVEGIDLEDKQVKEKIYSQYVEAFEKGVYDYIKEDYDEVTQEIIPRKYFSGGIEGTRNVGDRAMTSEERRDVLHGDESRLTVELLAKTPKPMHDPGHKNYSGRYEPFMRWLLQNQYLPVISLPRSSIVDLGSSYGYATIDMANQLLEINPDIHVFGIDSFEGVGKVDDSVRLPPNVTFVRDDNRLEGDQSLKEGIKIITSFNVWRYYNAENARLGILQMGEKLEEGGLLIVGDGGTKESGYDLSFVVMQRNQGRLVPKELVLSQISSIDDTVDFSIWANYIPGPWAQTIQSQLAELNSELNSAVTSVFIARQDDKEYMRRERENPDVVRLELPKMVLLEQLKVLEAHGMKYARSSDDTITIPLEQFFDEQDVAVEPHSLSAKMSRLVPKRSLGSKIREAFNKVYPMGASGKLFGRYRPEKMFRNRVEWYIGETLEKLRSSGETEFSLRDFIKTYLTLRRNEDEDVRGVLGVIENTDHLILEIGSGNTKTALALAESDKTTGVLATDIYREGELDTARDEMLEADKNFDAFRKGNLAAQTAELSNLAVVRAELTLLVGMPNESLDVILLVNPALDALRSLQTLLNEYGLKDKLKPNGQIVVKFLAKDGFDSQSISKLFSRDFDVIKTDDTTWRGVDLVANSSWPDSPGVLYTFTKKGNDNPGGIDLNPNNLDLNVQGDEVQMDFSAPQTLNNVQVEGFVPVIINVAPITNIPMLLGESEKIRAEEQLSLAQ